MGKNLILFSAILVLTLIFVSMLISYHVLAQETETAENLTVELPGAGILPDSPFYGLERALERVRLALTFNRAEKAKRGLAYAEERLAEVKAMIEQKKFNAAEKAKQEHQKLMQQVKERIQEIEETNATREAEEKIRIENRIRKQDIALDEIDSEIKLKVRGNLTAEQQILLDNLIASFRNSTAEAKIQIKIGIGKTEIKIKQRTGKSVEEIKEKIQKIRNETGSIEICEARNKLLVRNLEKRIGAIQERLEAENLSGVNTTALQKILEQLKEIKEKAELKLKEKEQACDEAEKLAENAREIAEDASELEEKGTANAAESIARVIAKMQQMQEAGIKGINTSNVIQKLTLVRTSLLEKAEFKEQIEKATAMRVEIKEKLQELKEAKRINAAETLRAAREIKASIKAREQASGEEEEGNKIQEAETD